jgi:hypothetical protein
MSIRSRLTSALGALLGEPVSPVAVAEIAYLRSTVARLSEHLDDIRCDLAGAGVPIPEDDDPETTPRRMVRALFSRWDDSREMADKLLDESIAACDILGIDRAGDYDYLATLRALKERADGKAAKPAPAVPEARRMAILRAWVEHVELRGAFPTAAELGRFMFSLYDAFAGIGSETIAENARRLIGSDFSSNGKQGAPLTLTEKGRAALADSARVAS